MVKEFVRAITPPVVFKTAQRVRAAQIRSRTAKALAADVQDLELYWDPKMAQVLDTWGDGNAWHEIQYLLAAKSGRVLDIACGTGKTMELLGARFPQLEIHGCDISDFLIRKAVARGVPERNLVVGDATRLTYPDNFFDYSYSIGSLEHFTEPGIVAFVAECYRVTRRISFHQMPTARSGRDEGWMKTVQSFHNNSVPWWVAKFRTAYQRVEVLDSLWQDDISLGRWFVCIKDEA